MRIYHNICTRYVQDMRQCNQEFARLLFASKKKRWVYTENGRLDSAGFFMRKYRVDTAPTLATRTVQPSPPSIYLPWSWATHERPPTLNPVFVRGCYREQEAHAYGTSQSQLPRPPVPRQTMLKRTSWRMGIGRMGSIAGLVGRLASTLNNQCLNTLRLRGVFKEPPT